MQEVVVRGEPYCMLSLPADGKSFTKEYCFVYFTPFMSIQWYFKQFKANKFNRTIVS